MSDSIDPTRRAKRFLSAEQKYEIWLKILCGELTTNEAAAHAGVDRSTVRILLQGWDPGTHGVPSFCRTSQ